MAVADITKAEKALQDELDKIKSRLEGVDELLQERDKIEATLRVLRGEATVSTGRSTRASSASSGTRAPRGERKADVLRFIKDHPDGSAPADIREATGVDSNYLSVILKGLVEDKEIRKEGKGRAGRYFPA